jgi:hypothetical protein
VDRGRRAARIPLGEIGQDLSPFPYVLMLGQDDNERILGERLRELGIDVQWNTELVALEQKSDRVEVELKQPDGSTRRVTPRGSPAATARAARCASAAASVFPARRTSTRSSSPTPPPSGR